MNSCARPRLCYLAGGELDQIQFLLGHVSIQTTERYVGCKQKLRFAVNFATTVGRRAVEVGWRIMVLFADCGPELAPVEYNYSVRPSET
jgi:hypothetical protein